MLDRVSVPHSNSVHYALDDEGVRWVVKREMFGVNVLLAEAIGYELSTLLGIKSPRPGLLSDQGDYLWMTEYSPDPFLGGRIPVAALVRTQAGVRAVSSRSLPAGQCAGGAAMELLVRTAVRSIEEPLNLDQLPAGVGPHFSLSPDVRDIPARVAKPDEWLADLLSANSSSGSKGSQGPKTATEGRRFLKLHGVDEYVQNKFVPSETVLPGFSGRLPAITHFVCGRQLLLMEPISARAAHSRIIEINTRFGAYKQAFQREPSNLSPRMITYVLPGARHKDTSGLTFADEVFEADDAGSCRRLVEEIRAAA